MIIRIFCLFLLLFELNGCTSGIGVAASGAQAVYNRHGIQQSLTDRYICMRSYRKIYSDTNRYVHANIAVASLNSEVLVTGEIPNPEFRNEVTELIKSIPQVNEVHNMLAVASPSSPLTRMSDSWLTAKIKSKLLASQNLDSSRIKVVSENGTVFLMGTILPEEANAAVELARNTVGVQSVVKLFNYIHISKKS